MKKFFLRAFVFSVVLLSLSGCKHDNEPEKEDVDILLPSTSFGKNHEEVTTEEKQRGFEIIKDGELSLIKASVASKNVTFTYYFGLDDLYHVATCELPSNISLSAFEKGLQSKGFVINASASKNEKEKVFVNSEKNITLALSVRNNGGLETLSYSFGKLDETIFSWTRTSTLQHESGLYIPLIAKDSSVDLMNRFESRLNHTLSSDSKPDNGVYIFDTQDAKFPKIKYWFDVNKKAFLEEIAIFVNADDRPTPQQVDSFLTTNGYKLTSLKDNGNPVYYNKKIKAAVTVEMNKPATGVFEPKIQFYYSDEIDGKLPKEIVNLPIPILEFGKITLDEAVEKFKNEPYYKSHEVNNEMGGFNIITNSEDFPKIWIDQDGGKYALACAIAQDFRVINSEDIVAKLKVAGFTEKGTQTIETYLNREKNAMAQIDRAGSFGVPCVAFNVIE